MAGSNPQKEKYGTIFQFFNEKTKRETGVENQEPGKEASIAVSKLLESGSIQTLLSTFIVPLQQMADPQSRVHTSLNIGTETGRLSSRRPNLQNQPALEKDKYKIRAAFTADSPQKQLIVADYGQLELRLLAHITKCKSMIDAFESGGDFHSRTVREEIRKKERKNECVYLSFSKQTGIGNVSRVKEENCRGHIVA